jgi:hypothetical protein
MLNILENATENQDNNTLSQIIAVVTSHYTKNDTLLIDNIFMPALEALSKQPENGCYWVNDFLYHNNKTNILTDMNNTHYQKILDNLIPFPSINYYIEEILLPIAKKSPEMVLDFFIKRFDYKKQNDAIDNRYDALPFSGFHKLSEPLAVNPSLVLKKAFATCDDKQYWDFENCGQLIHHIFSTFPDTLEKALIEYVHKDKFYWKAIICFLKTYKGNVCIHNICKEMIKVVDDESIDTLHHIFTSRFSTTGEYGIAEFYENKAREFEPWLDDSDVKIRSFAQEFIEATKQQATRHRKRIDEEIILRKHEYGMDITNE